MNIQTPTSDDLFYRALGGVTVSVPLLLVAATGAYPDGERGTLILQGFGTLLVTVAIALILRAAYSWGFKNALINAAVASTRRGAVEYSKQSCAM